MVIISDKVDQMYMSVIFWIQTLVLTGGLSIPGIWLFKIRSKKRRLRELRIRLEAQEQEKERIAKDLHDYFGARLSTLKLYMQTINKFDAGRIATMTSVAMQMVDGTIVELRHLLFDLDPKKLYKGGLTDAVTELCNNIRSIFKLDISFSHENFDGEMGYNSEVSIYRIIQEFINNTLKHAKATKIRIKLVQEKKERILRYYDDGIGFDKEKVTQGYGLRNIDQHVLALEACTTMSTAPGKGFECKMTIPIK